MSSKQNHTERFKGKTSYAIYCVNIFGSGLKAIKDEFKRQVNKGLRQTVFVLDLEDLQTELNNQPRNAKMKRDFQKNSQIELINLIQQNIQKIQRDYDKLLKDIRDELKFDLYEYWLQPNAEINKNKNGKPAKEYDKKKLKDVKENEEVLCSSSLVIKEHNTIGQSKLLSQREYIKDEPILGKLYIIILGQMSKSFYMDLLRRDQSLEGVLNFVPIESNYDIMLGNNKLRNFIVNCSETIKNLFLNLRQEKILKPVGLFNHELPVISSCLAAKHSREIFDQLAWCIYDIDILKQQYENYYFKPFQVTDVKIPEGENITQLYHMAESLNTQGQYQKTPVPTTEADLASIAAYLNSLLNACDFLVDGFTQKCDSDVLTPNSFSSITNMLRFNRLVVAENNHLLLNMLKYAESDDFKSMHLKCLEYNTIGKFAISERLEPPFKVNQNDASKLPQVPKYAKYFVNNECCLQRLNELKKEYDEYEIQSIDSGYKLYIFKRNLNVLSNSENKIIIPTRLCFRDFTLFQMEEFLKDLQKPEVTKRAGSEKMQKIIDVEKNIFIRPNSLKAVKMPTELNGEVHKRKSESRATRRKTENGSSFSKPTTTAQNNQGLPKDHHLLKGYNLDDTLQEIIVKTLLYNFHQGFIRLYVEKWCFQDMNKQLSLAIHNVTLFFSRPRHHQKGILNNIRLVTQDNIGIRILNNTKECSKVVMNYPNGLSIYQQENDCEQIWYCEKTPGDEHKRIFTKFGAIIVFFKSGDIIIMRYNGEIYRLYQHELEEEEGEEEHLEQLENIESKSSELVDHKSQKQNRNGRKLSQSGKKSKNTKKSSSDESMKTSSSATSFKPDLVALLHFELRFLNVLCSFYGLTYLRLSITTAQGKVINVTPQGELAEGRHCSTKDWFDYFANEAYCERGDGVKMIWGQNSFKCFHKDGTLFNTSVEKDSTVMEKDELESQVTESSSHNEFLGHEESFIYHKSSNSDYTYGQHEDEDYKPMDVTFAQYKCQSICMQHPNYAKVSTSELDSNLPNLEIIGINNTRIFSHQEKSVERDLETYGDGAGESEDVMEEKSNKMFVINVSFEKNLKIEVDNESCKIYAIMPNSNNEKETQRDSWCLSLKFTDHINDVFNAWVKEIDSFGYKNEHKLREFYFIEKTNNNSSARGFEFYPSLPITSNYTYRMKNYIIELKGINNINQTLMSSSQEYEKDLQKFPRFKTRRKVQNANISEEEVPSTLSVNVYMEIPNQLRTLTNITKFLEPFEDIYFKNLRGKFKNVLDHYLRPKQQFHLKVLCSRIKWKNRLWEHQKRVFNEQQRRGLYFAMIEHEAYPNYWKFSQVYESDVRCIEFFDFVQNQCTCNNNQVK